jgi:cytosine/adenosine deaminase-related metal-dependent hydrolase
MAAGMLGMHASMSLNDETLCKIAATLNGAVIHIHVAESITDQEDSLRKYNLRVVERLDKFGLISKDSLLVHCVHVNDRELDIIKQRNAVIAINPSSNMNNAVGLPDYLRFKNKGIRVIIGHDGLDLGMANEYRNFLFTQHLQSQNPAGVTLDDLKNVINDTYEYASRRLKVHLGRIKPGYQADFLLLPYEPPTPLDGSNAFGHLVYGVYPNFHPQHVFVGGEHLLKDYQISRNLNEYYNQAVASANRLWKKL